MIKPKAATAHLPQHIAIVMDGNGRWAKKRLLPRVAGHKVGVRAARKIVKYCATLGVPVLSLFAFSSENWRRPSQEVSYLMDLLLKGLEREIPTLKKYGIRLRFIGNRDRFSPALQAKITEVETLTAMHAGMTLIIAADYGGQWDITTSVKQLAAKIESGAIKSADVNAELISAHLSFADLPDPDLFIRTSGEIRISNFMLWQLAYSELYFTDVLWPDFNEQELDKALTYFKQRERRFGHTSAQLDGSLC